MKRLVLISCLLLVGLAAFSAEIKKGVGGWVTWDDTDPFSDATNIILTQTAKDEVNAQLSVRLSNDELEIFISWNCFLTTDDSVKVLSRIDKDQSQEVAWNVSTDQKATFFEEDTEAMLLRMMSGTTLAARVIPYGESPVVAIFDLTGLKETMSAYPSFVQWVSSRAPATTE